MSKTARELITDAATISLYPWDSGSNDYSQDAKQLCGVDTISFSDGAAEEKDVTDFCDAATGVRRKISGLKEPGSLSFNIVRYDPKQEGQKWLHDAPQNTKFKVVIELENDTVTLNLKKKTNANFEMKVGEQLSGSMECFVESVDVWS